MFSHTSKKPDPVVTQSMLTATLKSELGILRNELRSELRSELRTERKSISQEIVQTTLEATNAVLEAVQRMFEEQDQRYEEKFKEFRKENLGYMDALMTELKAMREEYAVSTYRQAQHSDQLEKHETRIVMIENKLQLA